MQNQNSHFHLLQYFFCSNHRNQKNISSRKNKKCIKDKEKPASWIYTVAINTSISKVRKDSRIEFRDSPPDGEPVDPWEQQEQDENWQRLVNALQKLNEIDKSIMLLYMEDYSYEEIAGIVGISSSAVGVKIHRLKGQLQKQFKK